MHPIQSAGLTPFRSGFQGNRKRQTSDTREGNRGELVGSPSLPTLQWRRRQPLPSVPWQATFPSLGYFERPRSKTTLKGFVPIGRRGGQLGHPETVLAGPVFSPWRFIQVMTRQSAAGEKTTRHPVPSAPRRLVLSPPRESPTPAFKRHCS